MPKPTSPRQKAASRANGGRSQGPKTQPGKAASSRNAFKHGLSQPISFDGEALPPKVEALARAYAEGESKRWPWAVEAATAHFNLIRLRRAEQLLIEQRVAYLRAGEPDASDDELEARALRDCAPNLRTFATYRRKYRSWAKRVLRELDAIPAEGATGQEDNDLMSSLPPIEELLQA